MTGSSLEDVVRSEERSQRIRLVHGDRLHQVVRLRDDDRVFVLTEQGDVWVTRKKRVFRAGIDGKVICEYALPDNYSFVQQKGLMRILLDDAQQLSRKYLHKDFLPQEKEMFERQIGSLVENEPGTVVTNEWLSEQLRGYHSVKGPISPFSREAFSQELLIESEEGSLRSPTALDAYILRHLRRHAEGKELPVPSNELEKRASRFIKMLSYDRERKLVEEVLGSYLLRRRVKTKQTIARFLHEHQMKNADDRWTQLYSFKKQHGEWSFFLEQGDQPCRVMIAVSKESAKKESGPEERDVFRSRKDDAFVSKDDPSQPVVSQEWEDHGKILSYDASKNRWFQKGTRWLRTVYDEGRHRWKAYALSALLCFGIGGGAMIDQHHDLRATKIGLGKEKNKLSVSSENVVRTASKKEGHNLSDHDVLTYRVQKGDCLWTIAEEHYSVKTNKGIVRKVNELAKRMGKVSLSEYDSLIRKDGFVSPSKNPHLIFPGQKVMISSREREGIRDEMLVVRKSMVKKNDQSSFPRKKAIIKDGIREESFTGVRPLEEKISSASLPLRKEPAIREGSSSVLLTYKKVLQELVLKRRRGDDFESLRREYGGFRDVEEVKQALKEYQLLVASGVLRSKEYLSYEQGIASDELHQRMIFEYQRGRGTLSDARRRLREQFGVDVSEGMISKYARRRLNVSSRKEARRRMLFSSSA